MKLVHKIKCVLCCASGIARGSGWQHIGAYVNLGAFYLFGIPIAVVLGFILHLNAKGLWIGIVVGSIIQSSILFLITSFTNWQKQVVEFNININNIIPLIFLSLSSSEYISCQFITTFALVL